MNSDLQSKLYLHNPELGTKYGKIARQVVSEKFTVEIINNKILKIYENFLKIKI